MSGKIKILPAEVVNKIAAGEVIENPASIVKELIDNAIDAYAVNIVIEIENGGIDKILVTDNGNGMTPEDVKLCFRAHSTSKLSTEEDLLRIKTYGFRGEALSSIAAVSRLTIRSKTPNAKVGFEIIAEGGEIISEKEVGMNSGTHVIVENLFYNVPARKEFLRSAQSEYKTVQRVVNAHALANPKVGFIFRHNDKQIYVTPRGHQLENRIHEILGIDNAEKMVSVFYEHPYVEIYGFIGKPELATQKKKNQYIFVNKRLIRDKTIEGAIKKAYSGLIPNNTWPPFVIFIDLEPNVVDVNVHPRKEEVKFSDGQLVFKSVQTAVKKSLERHNLTPGALNNNIKVDPFGNPIPNPQVNPFGVQPTPFGTKPNPFGTKPTPFGTKPSPFGTKPTPLGTKPNPFGTKPTPLGTKPSPFGTKPNAFGVKPNPNNDPLQSNWLNNADTPNQSETDTPKNYPPLLVVHNLYWIMESQNGFIIYDQHAVHERILYEKFLNAHKKKKENSDIQPLLTPVVLNLSFEESDTMQENMQHLINIGFAIEEFGGTSYKVTAVPAELSQLNIKKLIKDVLNDLDDNPKDIKVDSQTNRAITYLACRSAYKAGDRIPLEEIHALLDQLEKTEVKYTCPHGRPVKIELTLKELEKMFLRKQ